MQTVFHHLLRCKLQLAFLSPAQVRFHHCNSIAQVRVWDPVIRVFVLSAARYGAVSSHCARTVNDALDDWESCALPLRLAILGFLVDVLTTVLQATDESSHRMLGDFATKVLATSQQILAPDLLTPISVE